jgi:predicted HicB family RNase H-like nuclease
MPRGNPSPKLAITVDPEIHENILAAAARDGVSVSSFGLRQKTTRGRSPFAPANAM